MNNHNLNLHKETIVDFLKKDSQDLAPLTSILQGKKIIIPDIIEVSYELIVHSFSDIGVKMCLIVLEKEVVCDELKKDEPIELSYSLGSLKISFKLYFEKYSLLEREFSIKYNAEACWDSTCKNFSDTVISVKL